MRRFGMFAFVAVALAATAFSDDTPSKDAPSKDAPSKDAVQPNGAAAPAARQESGAVAPDRPKAKEVRAELPPAPKSLAEAMTRLGRVRVDVDFRDAKLADAAQFVATVARMNVILSPALRAAGEDALPKIDLRLVRVSLKQVAELLAKTTGTRLVLREGILQFTTPADARGKPVLRIYPLADLTMRIRNFPGPDIRLHLASVEFEDEKESDVESPFDDPAEIVETIRKMTGADTWDDDDVSISADSNKLVVRQYGEVHREIARLLGVLRAAK